MLNVQKYLLNHTLEDLENEFGIVITYYNDRVVLNYSQIDSPKFHPICDECRGLILSYPDYKVLCRSFDRFYNLGENGYFNEYEFDITRAYSEVKVDGSLINIYHDRNNWCAATRKRAFAEGETNKGNTFKDVVNRALGYPVEEIDFGGFHDLTLICEVVSPETRVVVPYKEYRIYLLAARFRNTGRYISRPDLEWIAYELGMATVACYDFKSFDDVIKACKELKPMAEDGEGYVCFDEYTHNRVKIKNPGYLAIAHLRNNGAISNKRIAVLVFNNDYDEYLNYFPEDKEFFDPYILAYHNMIKDIYDYWNLYGDINSQKEFALTIKDFIIAPILFSIRKGLTMEEIFDNMTDKKKEELLVKYKN